MQIVPSASGTGYELAPLNPALNRTLSDDEAKRLRTANGERWVPSKNCLTCEKKGEFKTRLADDSIVTCKCSCIEQWMLYKILLSSGIGDTYQRYSWNHVKTVPEEVLLTVQTYLDNLDNLQRNGIGMILWSERTGTGKTLLATLLLKEILSRGHDCYFTSFRDMIDQYTAAWSSAESRAWFTRRIQNAGHLVIDDVGKENPNRVNVVDELLDGTIRHRVAHSRSTTLTANLNPDPTGETRDVGKDFSRYQSGFLDLLSERSLKLEVTGQGFRSQHHDRLLLDSLEGITYPVVIR